jgi:hypothetical protein
MPCLLPSALLYHPLLISSAPLQGRPVPPLAAPFVRLLLLQGVINLGEGKQQAAADKLAEAHALCKALMVDPEAVDGLLKLGASQVVLRLLQTRYSNDMHYRCAETICAADAPQRYTTICAADALACLVWNTDAVSTENPPMSAGTGVFEGFSGCLRCFGVVLAGDQVT